MMFEPRQEYLGLDVSDRSLKAIQFKRTLANRLVVAGLGQLELPAGVLVDGDIKQPTAFAQAITTLVTRPQRGRFTTTYTVASLPETKTFIKLIDVPNMSPEELPQAIRWEAEHHIPIPIDETYWDWQPVDAPTKANARLPILLGVAPRTIVDSYVGVMQQARLVPVALEIEAAAIARSLLPLAAAAPNATIIIDLGASRTGLIVFDNQTIQFTVSLPISGRQVTNRIAATLKLSEEQAEEAKIVCGLDPSKCHGALGEILHDTMDQLIRSIREAIVFYREHFPQSRDIGSVLLCGGGANFKDIDTYLGKALNLPIKRGNPWRNLPGNAPLPPGELISYATAIGLALRSTVVSNSHD